jgi:hypothetical protein
MAFQLRALGRGVYHQGPYWSSLLDGRADEVDGGADRVEAPGRPPSRQVVGGSPGDGEGQGPAYSKNRWLHRVCQGGTILCLFALALAYVLLFWVFLFP